MLASNVTDADLREAIAAFRQHIRAYQATLRQQGTWLMLATFGCWGLLVFSAISDGTQS